MAFEIKNHRLYSNGQPVAFIQTPNGGSTIDPKYTVVHYTAGQTMESARNVFTRKDSQASAHLIIGVDGTVWQMQPFNKSCWHAGKSQWDGISGLNSHSVGIEVVNPGALDIVASVHSKNGDGVGRYRTWYKAELTTVEYPDIVEGPHPNGGPSKGWLPFSDAQIAATMEICFLLREKYGTRETVGHDMISPGRKQDPGLCLHSSFYGFVNGRDESTEAVYEVFNTGNVNLNVRAAPSPNAHRLHGFPAGTKVERLQIQGEWWKVEMVDAPKHEGWVHSKYLRRV